jgi:hypothetical protein
MAPDPPRRPPLSTAVLLLIAAVGLWPLVNLAPETTGRTWLLAVPAVALGAALAVWLHQRQLRLPFGGSRAWRRLDLCLIVAVTPTVAITSAPAGVRMIYSAALEGIICAFAVLGGRISH